MLQTARRMNPQGLAHTLNGALALACAVAVLLVARQAVTRYGAPSGAEPGPGQGVSSAPERPGGPVMGYYSPVVEQNVFGFEPERFEHIALRAAQISAEPASAPISVRTDFKAMGTIAWADGFGYAVLDDHGTQELYRVGTELPGGARLISVKADAAVLMASGRMIELKLNDESAPAAQASAAARPAPAPGRPFASGRSAGPDLGQFARQTAEGQFVVDRDAVQESIASPKRIMTDARLLPKTGPDGSQIGFVIKEIKPGGVYENLGLQDGDILMAVNGLKLSSPETALQAFSALQGMSNIQLDIERDGARSTLRYNIQ